MKTLKESLFNKKTLSSISEFIDFIDKGSSDLFDFIIDEKKTLSDEYIILSVTSENIGANGRIDGLVLCPSVEKFDEFIRNADSWPELNVRDSLITYNMKDRDIRQQGFVLLTICKRKVTDKYSVLDYGIYCFSKTHRNEFFNKVIIDDIRVTNNIKNINDLKEILK